MIKIIVQKIKNLKKWRNRRNFWKRNGKKKALLELFARTRANKNYFFHSNDEEAQLLLYIPKIVLVDGCNLWNKDFADMYCTNHWTRYHRRVLHILFRCDSEGLLSFWSFMIIKVDKSWKQFSLACYLYEIDNKHVPYLLCGHFFSFIRHSGKMGVNYLAFWQKNNASKKIWEFVVQEIYGIF